MKYLSSKPFTGGANSQAFVDRWDEAFGKKDDAPLDPDKLCEDVVEGSSCRLPFEHGGKHYTQKEKAEFQANKARREAARLDFLADWELKSRVVLGELPYCDGDAEVSAAKDRTPFTSIDRHVTMVGLERKLKQSYLDQVELTLSREEIFVLLLMFQDLRNPSPQSGDPL
jgi:hypothetical protein